MLHFEDRQKLHKLAQPVEPTHDLWPQVAARIASSARSPHRRMRWLALAASVAGVAVLAGIIGIRLVHDRPLRAATFHSSVPFAVNADPARAWKPADPRLRGAAIELRAAQGELQQAMAMAPHADYLQQLLQHTERQQSRLQRLERDAG